MEQWNNEKREAKLPVLFVILIRHTYKFLEIGLTMKIKQH